MRVDLVSAELKSEVIDLEVGVDHPDRGIEHPVALLLVQGHSRRIAGERSGGRVDAQVIGVGTLEIVD
jgi:hypothetical protein